MSREGGALFCAPLQCGSSCVLGGEQKKQFGSLFSNENR